MFTAMQAGDDLLQAQNLHRFFGTAAKKAVSMQAGDDLLKAQALLDHRLNSDILKLSGDGGDALFEGANRAPLHRSHRDR